MIINHYKVEIHPDACTLVHIVSSNFPISLLRLNLPHCEFNTGVHYYLQKSNW